MLLKSAGFPTWKMGLIIASTFQVTEKIKWVLKIGLVHLLCCVFANTWPKPFCYNYLWFAIWVIFLFSLIIEECNKIELCGLERSRLDSSKVCKQQTFIGEENREQLHLCSRARLSEEEIWEEAPWPLGSWNPYGSARPSLPSALQDRGIPSSSNLSIQEHIKRMVLPVAPRIHLASF